MSSKIVRPNSDAGFSFVTGKPSGGKAIRTAVNGLYRQHVIL